MHGAFQINRVKFLVLCIHFYKKELTFYKVTSALFIFVERQGSAVQLGLMGVI